MNNLNTNMWKRNVKTTHIRRENKKNRREISKLLHANARYCHIDDKKGIIIKTILHELNA